MLFHPMAWILWWLAALVAALLTQNPLYQTLLLLIALWVRVVLRQAVGAPVDPMSRAVLRWGVLLVGMAALFNGLTIHVGATVIARLPAWLPMIGGPITLEAITFGLMSGLGLLTLIMIFAAFNVAANYQAILRLMPSFLFQAGLVTSIALAFVPQTLKALDEIREAQMIRGHRFRGWRDLPPLFLPLLTSGLERSIQLAEAMETRGFGAVYQAMPATTTGERQFALRKPTPIWPQVAALCGLVATLLGAGTAMLLGERPLGLLLGGVGTVLLLLGLRQRARVVRPPRSRYRPQPWRRSDKVLAGGSIGILAGLLALNTLTPATFLFYPYPRLRPPPFDPLVGGLLLLLVLPIFLVSSSSGTTTTTGVIDGTPQNPQEDLA